MAPPRFFESSPVVDTPPPRNGNGSTPSPLSVTDAGRLTRLPFGAPRSIVGAAERISTGPTSKNTTNRVEKRTPSAWQTQAWQAFEAIGEVHYAVSLLGAVMSRVRLYIGVVTHADQPPSHIDDYLETLQEADPTPADSRTRDTLTQARHLLSQLTAQTPGGEGGMLRQIGINLSVPGELYLANTAPGRWEIASTDELVRHPDGTYALRSSRQDAQASPLASSRAKKGDLPLPRDAFVARIWRSHPRYSREPDSSLLGVLDSCEQLILLQQTLRSITRSRMGAGLVFIPEGIATSLNLDGQTDQVEEAITRAAMTAVEDEASSDTVVPLVLKGPAELGKEIRWIPYGRPVEDQLVSLIDRTLERIMQGLDIPKDVVAGLSNVRYSNAIIIDDNLYRSHIEPLVLLATDALTSVYLRPNLIRSTDPTPDALANPDHLINRIVVWADTSAVVTRPDRSAAANEGFDKRILSADAWRDARGFSDADAPSPEELLQRIVLDRGQIPPDLVQTLLELVAPAFFNELQAGTAEALPPEVSDLLLPNGGQPQPRPSGPGAQGVPPSVANRDRSQEEPQRTQRPPSNLNGEQTPTSPGGSPAPIPGR
jgi:hypothetical protein